MNTTSNQCILDDKGSIVQTVVTLVVGEYATVGWASRLSGWEGEVEVNSPCSASPPRAKRARRERGEMQRGCARVVN